MLESQVIELSHDAIIIADASRVISGWNSGADEIYGIPKEQAIGKTTHALLGTRSAVTTAEIDEILYRDGRWDGELIQTRADGSQITVDSRQVVVRDGGGTPVAILEINRDITARKQAEAALRASEERYQAFMDNSPTVAWMKDEHGRIVYLSKSYEKALGVHFEDWRGKNDFELWPREIAEQFRKNDLEVLASGRTFEGPEESAGPDGERRHWWSVKFPFQDAAGNKYVGGVALDVTQQKRMEERVWQAQKLESIGVLAGGIAHSFNNLLTVVLGNATLAKGRCPAACEEVEAIASAAERAADLTRHLTAYAGMGHFLPRKLRVSTAVGEMTELLRASVPASIDLDLGLSPDPYCILADPAQVQQILLNLVINAAEAIENGKRGAINVSTGLRHFAEAEEGPPGYTLSPGTYIAISVNDTGCGMGQETISRIFDPFFTTKFTGRGLGLAAVAGIVRTLRGAIVVESTPGQGSTLTVLLPAVPPGDEPQEDQPAHSRDIGRRPGDRDAATPDRIPAHRRPTKDSSITPSAHAHSARRWA